VVNLECTRVTKRTGTERECNVEFDSYDIRRTQGDKGRVDIKDVSVVVGA
jgi:hypothetical protein